MEMRKHYLLEILTMGPFKYLLFLFVHQKRSRASILDENYANFALLELLTAKNTVHLASNRYWYNNNN